MKPNLLGLWERYRALELEGPSLKTLAVLRAINKTDPEDLNAYRLLAVLYQQLDLAEECIEQYSVLVQYLFEMHGTRAIIPQLGRAASEDDEYLNLVRQQIAAGESRHREFKSTLRRNLKTGANDDVITVAILRTLAAFLNTDGGVLYIGVADDGTIVGLANDGFASPDQLQRFLNDKVRSHLGVLAAALLHPTLLTFPGNEQICVVECRPAEKLVFMTSGKYRDVCFVRTGPATVELPPSQLVDYVSARSTKGVARSTGT